MKIDKFKDKYFWLSNFHPVTIEMDGDLYPTVEHAYQALKTIDPTWRARIRWATTPGKAKRLGREAPLRTDWDYMKIGVMYCLLTTKFAYPQLKQRLLDTNDDELIEGNEWGDTFWGQCKGEGDNWLGRLLMDVRHGLRRAVK